MSYSNKMELPILNQQDRRNVATVLGLIKSAKERRLKGYSLN
ncbi:MAG: hypothetical protein Q7S74_02130 [Nanoarchaeota archaeon]|nr:hypothetical protein [Nanoarchaeota archaeon]